MAVMEAILLALSENRGVAIFIQIIDIYTLYH